MFSGSFLRYFLLALQIKNSMSSSDLPAFNFFCSFCFDFEYTFILLILIDPKLIEHGNRVVHFIVNSAPKGGAGKTFPASLMEKRHPRRVVHVRTSDNNRDMEEVLRTWSCNYDCDGKSMV